MEEKRRPTRRRRGKEMREDERRGRGSDAKRSTRKACLSSSPSLALSLSLFLWDQLTSRLCLLFFPFLYSSLRMFIIIYFFFFFFQIHHTSGVHECESEAEAAAHHRTRRSRRGKKKKNIPREKKLKKIEKCIKMLFFLLFCIFSDFFLSPYVVVPMSDVGEEVWSTDHDSKKTTNQKKLSKKIRWKITFLNTFWIFCNFFLRFF